MPLTQILAFRGRYSNNPLFPNGRDNHFLSIKIDQYHLRPSPILITCPPCPLTQSTNEKRSIWILYNDSPKTSLWVLGTISSIKPSGSILPSLKPSKYH